MHSIRAVSLVLVFAGTLNSRLWAQQAPAENLPPASTPSSPAAPSAESDGDPAVQSQAAKRAQQIDDDGTYELKPGDDPDNHLLLPFVKHLASDQKAFWIAPMHFQKKDIEWIAPFAGVTAGFIAGDSWISNQIPLGEVHRSKTVSNYATYSLIGVGAGSFLLGHLRGDDRMSEAGLLSGEAAINSTTVTYLLKSVTQRPRPLQDNGNGTFFQGGNSFPSEHSAIAWSIASVLAHEYPGTLTKILAYGLATGVSATRLTGQQHFASDAIIGSALGWYFGRQVYRAHHDRDLGGAAWGDLLPSYSGEQTRNPENMGSPYLPVDSWVYPLFDRLVAMGYVNTASMGMRPWTRIECARLVDEVSASIQLDTASADDGQPMYQALATEFADERSRLDGAGNVGASLDSIYTRFTGISGPTLRDGYHFAQTIINNYGRPYGEGFNNVTGVTAHAVAGPFAFSIQAEYQHAPAVASDPLGVLQAIAAADGTLPLANGTAAINRLRLLESSVSFTMRNMQFSFGTQGLWLGPGQAGPFLFSDNAEPIPMFRIDQVSPVYVPLLSRVLGPMRAEFALGRLSGQTWAFANQKLFGPHLNNQPFIHVDKISFKPTANVEFGVGVSVIFGGPDLPFTWKNFLRTYSNNGVPGTGSDAGDRRSTFEFSYRVPWLRDRLTIYADSLVEDEVSPLGSTRPSMRMGIYLPRVPKVPKLDLRAEGLYTDVPGQNVRGFIYWNGRFLSGYTNEGNLLASWVGRQGKGGQGWATYWFSGRSNLQFSFRRQVVDRVFIGGGQLNAAAAGCEIALPRGVGISAGVQYEQWGFPVLRAKRNSDTVARFQLTLNPHLRIEKSN